MATSLAQGSRRGQPPEPGGNGIGSSAGRPTAQTNVGPGGQRPGQRLDVGAAGSARRVADGRRHPLRNARIRLKVGLILVVPLLAILGLATFVIVDVAGGATASRDAERQYTVLQQSGRLVYQLQKERQLAADLVVERRGTLENTIAAKVKALNEQFKVTDKAIADTLAALQDARGALGGPAADDLNGNLRTVSDRVRLIRPKVTRTRGGFGVEQTRSEYAGVVGSAETIGTRVTQNFLGTDDHQTSKFSAAQAAFLQGVEADLNTELIVLGALNEGQKKLEAAQVIEYGRNAGIRSSQFELYEALSTADQRRPYSAASQAPQVEILRKIDEQILLSGTAAPLAGVSVGQWSEASSVKLEASLGTVARFDRDIADRTEARRGDALRSALIVTGVVLAALLLTILVTLFIAQSMIGPVIRLRTCALDVAFRSLPEAVRKLQDTEATPERSTPFGSRRAVPERASRTDVEPFQVDSRDEIGQLARAFNAVHREAVRVASEQATLRQNVSTMFVNLSRRSQLLVDRLMRQIDALESGEKDPDRLEELFKLDHLVTRMRRNDENLLVLAGAEVTRRWSESAPLHDVLRAASAEVEQYTRVEFGGVDDARIVGSAVNDVVHLIAELLENATTYSSPRTSVVVNAGRVGDRMVVEIEDHGIGMSADQLADINERLAKPPTVDVSVSKRMGLFVVGRLAVRHGIGIQLRSTESGGVLAVVSVPPSVIEAFGEPGRRRIEPQAEPKEQSGLLLPGDDRRSNDLEALPAAGVRVDRPPAVAPTKVNGSPLAAHRESPDVDKEDWTVASEADLRRPPPASLDEPTELTAILDAEVLEHDARSRMVDERQPVLPVVDPIVSPPAVAMPMDPAPSAPVPPEPFSSQLPVADLAISTPPAAVPASAPSREVPEEDQQDPGEAGPSILSVPEDGTAELPLGRLRMQPPAEQPTLDDDTVTLPIYEQVESEWFRSKSTRRPSSRQVPSRSAHSQQELSDSHDDSTALDGGARSDLLSASAAPSVSPTVTPPASTFAAPPAVPGSDESPRPALTGFPADVMRSGQSPSVSPVEPSVSAESFTDESDAGPSEPELIVGTESGQDSDDRAHTSPSPGSSATGGTARTGRATDRPELPRRVPGATADFGPLGGSRGESSPAVFGHGSSTLGRRPETVAPGQSGSTGGVDSGGPSRSDQAAEYGDQQVRPSRPRPLRADALQGFRSQVQRPAAVSGEADSVRPATRPAADKADEEQSQDRPAVSASERSPSAPAARSESVPAEGGEAVTSGWVSPADRGWQAASAASAPAAAVRTKSGLPKRVPMAQLVPGAVESSNPQRRPVGPSAARSPDAVRGVLSSYRSGTERGRHIGRSARSGFEVTRSDEDNVRQEEE